LPACASPPVPDLRSEPYLALVGKTPFHGDKPRGDARCAKAGVLVSKLGPTGASPVATAEELKRKSKERVEKWRIARSRQEDSGA
jgi:hypothetical protein